MNVESPSVKQTDVLIVGAGIAGLMAATALQDQGVRVIVLDKSRGVGGRLATRRVGTAVLDHGAQYFTARHPAFQALVRQWEADGLVSCWFEKPGAIPLDQDAADAGQAASEPCYVVPGGMTRLAKALAEPLTVHLNQRAMLLQRHGEGYRIQTEAGVNYQADRVILTAPLPQSIALLESGAIDVAPELLERLMGVTYDPCLALLAVLDRPPMLPAPGGFLPDSEIVGWVADNHQKGVSPNGYGLTVQASPVYSTAHYQLSDAELADILMREASPWLGDAVILAWQMKRWTYALARNTLSELFMQVNESPALLLAGDAFGGPRVESAALSGLAAAQAVRMDCHPDSATL